MYCSSAASFFIQSHFSAFVTLPSSSHPTRGFVKHTIIATIILFTFPSFSLHHEELFPSLSMSTIHSHLSPVLPPLLFLRLWILKLLTLLIFFVFLFPLSISPSISFFRPLLSFYTLFIRIFHFCSLLFFFFHSPQTPNSYLYREQYKHIYQFFSFPCSFYQIYSTSSFFPS